MRRGGFGGPDGLAAFLTDGRYDALVDATHPFAAQIAAHAAEAASKAGVARVKLVRPPFERHGGGPVRPGRRYAKRRRRRFRKARACSSPPGGASSPPSPRARISGAWSA